ncbi:MAG: SLC13 family permease [Rhodospirillales bacterium]|nr:SLC13 family permease [Rhodospirillales bacterium]MDH3910275.1 SLC13 family permease [Rhodospirillales bacterium]MDH3917174.1 SLC13 family permease [Rhodospirillales bacterium]MDH3968080.1 SLC13 family permease [Rhodospirillales bacterium]
MTFEQAAVFVVLAAAMALFIWGRWRYDIVAILALLAVVYLGIVPPEAAFSGFGHPAVITVAAVLVISRALQVSGVVNHLARLLAPTRGSTRHQIAATSSLAAVLSAFMNNVGALALMLPVTLRNAYRAGRSPSQVLMPLSFATLLGGLITLIGTPPNIVIATFREQYTGTAFKMFDFAPVGLAVAAVGLVYITTVGWRLIPRHRHGETDENDRFHIEAYITEAIVPEESTLAGEQVRKIEQLCENEVTVMAIIRGKRRVLAPSSVERLRPNDILLLEGDPASLEPLFDGAKLEQTGQQEIRAEQLRSDDVRVVEAVLMPNSPIEGQSMRGLRMHDRYGINLLAVARRGQAPKTRLGSIRFKTGDVLLLQGERNTLQQVLAALGCLPLAERGLKVARRRRILLPMGIFGAAIAAAAYGFVPVQIAFVTAVAALILTKTLSLRDVYDAVEWPIILLLGALIPVGEALQATGGTTLIAEAIVSLAGAVPTWTMLALLMVASMLLSDLIHNTPTAVLMAPVAVGIAQQLGLPVDPFLMAVAVGSASPYLTPIGHQSNTLVMGPGGYRFGDYARMGIPLEILIVAVAVPMIMWVWLP